MKLEPFFVCVYVATCALLLGCATPRPPDGASSAAGIKYDGNYQDAGIKYIGGTGYASQTYHDNYMRWYPAYGANAEAPANPFSLNAVAADANNLGIQVDTSHFPYVVTDEGAQAYEAMNRAQKAHTQMKYLALFFFGTTVYAIYRYGRLATKVRTLYQRVADNQQKETPMPDPDAQIAAVSAFIDTEVAQIASLTQQLAGAVAAQDTVSPDVQTALDALTAKVQNLQAQSSSGAPTPPVNVPAGTSAAPVDVPAGTSS